MFQYLLFWFICATVLFPAVQNGVACGFRSGGAGRVWQLTVSFLLRAVESAQSLGLALNAVSHKLGSEVSFVEAWLIDPANWYTVVFGQPLSYFHNVSWWFSTFYFSYGLLVLFTLGTEPIHPPEHSAWIAGHQAGALQLLCRFQRQADYFVVLICIIFACYCFLKRERSKL